MIVDANRAVICSFFDILMRDDNHLSCPLRYCLLPTIVAVGFRPNIPQGYKPKSWRNQFGNYWISPLEFHIEYVVKLVCKKREGENDEEKVVVTNNYDETCMI